MQKIHTLLTQKISWYRNWHEKPNHNYYHWSFLFLTIIFSGAIHVPLVQEIANTTSTIDVLEEIQESNAEAAVSRAVRIGEAGDRIIVKFKDDTLTVEKNALYNREGLRERSEMKGVRVKIVDIPRRAEPEEVIEELEAEYGDLIEYAEVDELIAPSFTPNDPSFSMQWPHSNIGSQEAWNLVSAENMDDIIIAIADTGVNCNHVDLVDSCVPGWNTYDNNSNSADVYGHGTKVAGAAAAVGNNGIGIAGVAYKAKIMPLRISLPSGSAYTSDAAEAIIWAADNGAKIVNTSYAFSPSSGAIANAAAYLRSKGGILVDSAGNSGGATGALVNNPDRITVGGTTKSDTKYSWSAYGMNVDITAPGCAGRTTLRTGGYGDGCGTSYSAPITAGALAVIMATQPGITGVEARDILFSTAKDLGAVGNDYYFGHGRIDLAAAVAMALGGQLPLPPDPSDTTAPTTPTNLSGTVGTGQINLTWNTSTDNVGVTGYKVYRNSSLLQTVTTNSFVDTNVTAGTSYTYRVSAHDAAGNNSSQSSAVTRTIPIPTDITPPSVPTNLIATPSTSKVELSWNASTDNVGVVGYRLYKDGSIYKTLATRSYTDTTISAGTTYSYKVAAYDAAGNTSAQSPETKTTTPTDTGDDTATLLEITSYNLTPGATEASLTVSINKPVALYVYYGTSYYSLNKSVVNKNRANDFTVSLPNLEPNTRYYYRILVQAQTGATEGTTKQNFTTLSN
jgi:chitodextrinase